MSEGHHRSSVCFLNDFCEYCGAMPIGELKKGHLKAWIDRHTTWKSPATVRGVIAIVLAALNYTEQMHGITNPLKGYKKPAAQPRLYSITPEDEQTIYENTDDFFGDFIFIAIHTGLRPFSELMKITAEDVIETDRGMMWSVYASKTRKTRRIPVLA